MTSVLRRGWLFVLVMVGVGANVFAVDKSPQEIKKAVTEVIQQRHPTDTPDWWRALGPKAPGVIIEMHGDTKHVYKRTRLVQGLAWFDTPEVDAFLKEQVEKDPDKIVKRAAIRTLGISQGEKAVDFIKPFLDDRDPQMRLAAASALKRIVSERSSSEASQILENYKKTEKQTWIVKKLNQPAPANKQWIVQRKSSRVVRNPVADKLSGKWNGFWMVPSGTIGMKSQTAVFDIKKQGQKLVGELTVEDKKKKTSYSLGPVARKKSELSGLLRHGSKKIPFTMNINRRQKSRFMVLSVPQLNAFFVARVPR